MGTCCCCRGFARQTLRDHCWLVAWGRGSWARWTSLQLCRMTGSCRSESRIPGSRESQPGATKYLTSMPVAAVAKAVEAAYHSHTADAGRRGGCNRVRRKVPGCALVISMADPASRFAGSSPERTAGGANSMRRSQLLGGGL